jgi:uncharacterized protein
VRRRIAVHMPSAIAVVLFAFAVVPARAEQLKVLFLVGGVAHDYHRLPAALVGHLKEKLQDRVAIDVTISKDLNNFRSDELAKYNLLMMNLCQQTELSPEQKNGFLNAVRNGLPVVALHCTFWCFQKWPEFKEVLGAFVPGHKRFGTFCVEAVKPGDAILRGVEQKFDLTDEPYIVDDRDASMKVLVRTCEPLAGRQAAEPEVWTKTYGKGRIFSMTFGHDARSQDSPNYLALLAGGIEWATGHEK